VLAYVLLNRIQEPFKAILRSNQAGFLQGRSCADHIHSIRCILQQHQEHRKPLSCCFVDYEKAFDSPHRETVWNILLAYGVPTKIVNLIKSLHHESKCRVRVENDYTDWFGVTTGVRQGCVLAPCLFVIIMDYILRLAVPPERGLNLTEDLTLCDLEFADDVVILEKDVPLVGEVLQRIKDCSESIGLKINFKKTKNMLNEFCRNQTNLQLGGECIESVDHFKYLGVHVTPDGSGDKELSIRIAQASSSFSGMKKIWRSNNFSTKTKCRLFNACIMPILLYGCESWHLTKAQQRKLLSVENRFLRQILGIRWHDFVTNDTVRERTSQPSVTSVILNRRLGWLGHVLRMSPESVGQASLFYNPGGTRRRGRPCLTIARAYTADLQNIGLTWEEAERLAQDRSAWRDLVATTCSTMGANVDR
jgi:hypothetical protein